MFKLMIGYTYDMYYGILYKVFEHKISSMTRTYDCVLMVYRYKSIKRLIT